jgi:hypothetical protein
MKICISFLRRNPASFKNHIYPTTPTSGAAASSLFKSKTATV